MMRSRTKRMRRSRSRRRTEPNLIVITIPVYIHCRAKRAIIIKYNQNSLGRRLSVWQVAYNIILVPDWADERAVYL